MEKTLEKKTAFEDNKQKRLSNRNASLFATRTKFIVTGANIYIQAIEPESPRYGDLWFDLSFLEIFNGN